MQFSKFSFSLYYARGPHANFRVCGGFYWALQTTFTSQAAPVKRKTKLTIPGAGLVMSGLGPGNGRTRRGVIESLLHVAGDAKPVRRARFLTGAGSGKTSVRRSHGVGRKSLGSWIKLTRLTIEAVERKRTRCSQQRQRRGGLSNSIRREGQHLRQMDLRRG